MASLHNARCTRGDVPVGTTAFGIGRGFSDSNLMPIVCQIVDRKYRATAYGFLNLVGCVVGGITIWLAGWVTIRGAVPALKAWPAVGMAAIQFEGSLPK